MKRIIRICVIALVLSVLLGGASFISGHKTAHACGSYEISSAHTVIQAQGAALTIELWFNTCNQQNFARVQMTSSTVTNLQVTVIRYSGPDGGYATQTSYPCNSPSTCSAPYSYNSPGIYSPNNPAQATVYFNNTVYVATYTF